MEFLWILFVAISWAQASPCTPAVDSCEFYVCEAARRPCGEKGYLQGFALPYCQVFLEKQAKFAPATQDWLKIVRVRLMQMTAQLPPQLSCEDIEQQAFAKHVPIYQETDYCKVGMMDKMGIGIYFWREIFNWQFLKTAFQIHKTCATGL